MGNADTEALAHGASEPANHPGRAGLVAAELVRAQYRNIPAAIAVNAIISGLLCLALEETVSLLRLGLWLGAVYVVAGARYFFWYRFNKATLTFASTLKWRQIAFFGSGINGLTWGIGGIVLYAAHSPASQFLLLITQFGMGAGAAYASAPAFAAVLAYLLPSVLLSSVPFFLEGDSVHVTLGAMLFVFVAAATHFTYGISRTIARAIALRFENIDLIDELRNQTWSPNRPAKRPKRPTSRSHASWPRPVTTCASRFTRWGSLSTRCKSRPCHLTAEPSSEISGGPWMPWRTFSTRCSMSRVSMQASCVRGSRPFRWLR